MMGPYGMGPFSPQPYASYPANVMAAQMSQMQLGGGVYGGYGGYGGPYGAAGFSPNTLPRPHQGQLAEGYEQQLPLGEGYPQSSPRPRFSPFSG